MLSARLHVSEAVRISYDLAGDLSGTLAEDLSDFGCGSLRFSEVGGLTESDVPTFSDELCPVCCVCAVSDFIAF